MHPGAPKATSRSHVCYIRASPSHARSHKRHALQLLCQSPVVRAILFQFLNSAPQFLLCLFSFPPLLLEFFQCPSGFCMFPIGFGEPSLIRTLLLIKLTAQGLDGFAALLYPLGVEWRRRTHVMCTQLHYICHVYTATVVSSDIVL